MKHIIVKKTPEATMKIIKECEDVFQAKGYLDGLEKGENPLAEGEYYIMPVTEKRVI
jgi:hypothetical protein